MGDPSGLASGKLQLPDASVATTTAGALSMTTDTCEFTSPVPVSLGSVVIPSVAEAPVSAASATVAGGGTVSRVKLTTALSVSPAAFVSLTTTVC